MTKKLLKVSNLHASYGRAQVLFGVEMSVSKGEVVTLLGRNGMGRSTTIKCLFGLLQSSSGLIEFQSQRVDHLPSFQIARKGLGLVPEGRQVFPNLTVEENLIATARDNKDSHLKPWTLDRVYQFFPRLRERQKNLGSQLSGGEQQMLAMARILRTGAKLLLLDEITEGLAPVIVQKLGEVVTSLRNKGFTIVLVEQNFRFAAPLADRHYVVEHGNVVEVVNKNELAEKAALLNEYLGV